MRLVLALTVAVLGLAAAPAHAADAATIWSKKCASCHGKTGAADTKMGKKHKVDDMTDAGWQERHSDEKLRKAIVEGVKGTKMKAFGDKYSAEEIDALVAHIRTLKKK